MIGEKFEEKEKKKIGSVAEISTRIARRKKVERYIVGACTKVNGTIRPKFIVDA